MAMFTPRAKDYLTTTTITTTKTTTISEDPNFDLLKQAIQEISKALQAIFTILCTTPTP